MARPPVVPVGPENLPLGHVDHDRRWQMTDSQLEACLSDARADPDLSKYGEIDSKPAYAIAGDERRVVAFRFAAPDILVIYYFKPGAGKPESKCMGSQ